MTKSDIFDFGTNGIAYTSAERGNAEKVKRFL